MQVGAGAGLVLGLGWLVVQQWLGSPDFKLRAEAAASAAVGVPVHVDRVTLDVWPVPAAALVAVRIGSQPALTIQRVEARAVLRPLLSGRLELSSLRVVRADIAQAGWEHLLAQRNKNAGVGGGGEKNAAPPITLPARVRVEGLTWRPLTGEPTTLDADLRIGPEQLPDTVSAKVLSGALRGAQLRLARRQLDWDVRVDYAGGHITGLISLDRMPLAGAAVSVRGTLTTEGVELAGLSRQRLTGRLSADTTLALRTGQPGAALDALQTQSSFTVRNAVVHGVDLARAVKTVGLSRGGETRLDSLAGQVSTRGKSVHFSQLLASSGVLSASGQVTVSPSQALRGRVQVSLGPGSIGQAVGVPLVLGGTVDAPELTLTRSAMLGAAVGTLVLPGVGTGAGASLGDKIGDKLQGLFGK